MILAYNQFYSFSPVLIVKENAVSLTVSANTSTTFWFTHNVLAYTSDGATDSIIVVS